MNDHTSHADRTSSRWNTRRLRIAMATGAVAGIAVLAALVVHSGLPEILRDLESAGWSLLWVIPARVISLSLDANAWKALLPMKRATVPWLAWIAAVRDAVNNLLPVARVGGEVAGVRLLMGRGISGPHAAASVIVEISLTLIVQTVFTLLGLVLLLYYLRDHQAARIVLIGLLVSLPVVAVFILLQYRWGLFQLLERGLAALTGRRVLSLAGDPGRLDRAIRALYRRRKAIVTAMVWQLLTMIGGAVELWFTLWLLDYPIDPAAAVMLESLAQATQSAAFLIPAGIGVREGSFVLFGTAAGMTPDMALALSFARRLRELGVGLPALVSWQWVEGRQLHRLLKRT